MNWIKLLRKTSPYIVMVIIAFLLMGVVSYYSANEVMRERLLKDSSNTLKTTEGNIAESLARVDIMLLTPYHFIRGTLDRAGNLNTILIYLQGTSNWMRRDLNGTPGFYGMYAYIDGQFLDGIGLDPGPGYDPTATPWYAAAETLEDGEVAYTSPYLDPRTGMRIISAVRNLYSLNGAYYGILSMDIDLAWLRAQYVRSLDLSTESYGFILNRNLRVISHPDENRIGQTLQEFNPDYRQIAEELPLDSDIRNRRITDVDGRDAMIYMRRIFNGWYVAMITPMESYYHDLYDIQINPSFLGLILILIFSLVMLRINAATIHADEISSYKSAFLAQMSHEIRTPMNVVIGMSELALRENDPAKVSEYVGGIKQAGHNLLSIINDILDISRIESGALKITPIAYYFASLLNDVISMIRVKIAEKPVVFMANIDAAIPNAMIGDESRVKQVLINLLSNAAKYTQEGFIALNVRGVIVEGKKALLTIEVSDSGVGIKKEDISAIFENFVRLDMENNRGVEGAGLGLVLTRNLCRAMGGDVTVASEYGKGSTFIATLAQQFDDDDGLATVENPAGKRVLCYEERENYAFSIFKTLDNLKVPANICNKKNEFLRELEHGAYPYAFVSAGLAEEALERIKTRFLPTNLVLLSNPGELVSYQNIPMLIMPAYSVPIANVLNNRTIFDQRKQRSIHFIAPDARILIVDDIATNVKVAEGLLTLYQPMIDSCYDGKTSVEMVRKHHYDIVFMDHMMPGVDGIEAVRQIREWEEEHQKSLRNSPEANFSEGLERRSTPIIALTANAVFGMKEMFLENGFNDYLAKPIEITKLDEIMAKWIPMDKRIRRGSPDIAYPGGSLPVREGTAGRTAANQKKGIINITGVDVSSGMENTGASSWNNYCDVLSLFCQDVTNRLKFLRNMPQGEDSAYFHTQVHAIRGAAASIGATETAAKAGRLEEAEKIAGPDSLREDIRGFCAEVETLLVRVQAALAGDEKTAGGLS
jgi:signal transduction histidine kinase/CheY-like chemotaxis protein